MILNLLRFCNDLRLTTTATLALSGLVASTASAQEARRVAPATPGDNTATGYDWSLGDASEASRGEAEEADAADAEPKPLAPVVREGWIVLPFMGAIFAGSGRTRAEQDCSPGACESMELEQAYEQNVNLLLGLNGLYHVLPMLRIGLGLQCVPQVSLDLPNYNSNVDLGSELAPLALVEGVFGGKHAGALRGFVGVPILFPYGETLAVIDEQRDECRGLIVDGVSCDVESGPYHGFTWGAAAAYIAQVVDGGAVRFELSFEYVRMSGPSQHASDATGNEMTDSLRWWGTRFSSRIGAEF